MDEKRHQELSGSGLRAFFKIAEIWELAEVEEQALLGGIEVSIFHRWKRDGDGSLNEDQLERISHVLGIYRSLQILLPTTGDGWIHRPNTDPMFGGRTAMEFMTEGGAAALAQVRYYLERKALTHVLPRSAREV